MKILYLTSPNAYKVRDISNMLAKLGEKVFVYHKKVNLKFLKKIKPDFIISDRYPFIIEKTICEFFRSRIINLHPSYLPYCRGSKPIFFSIWNKRPVGITIHQITKELDAGPILVQKKISFDREMILRDLYKLVREEFKILLRKNWFLIKNNKIKPKIQNLYIKEIYKDKEFNKIFKSKKLNFDMKIKIINDRKKI